MGFYHSLGYLIFGSRLRRLSEYFLSEVNKVYEQEGLAFDASWFPVFYILSSKQPVTLMDMATQLEVSHSAISQLVTSLKQKGFVKTSRCKDDGRRQLVVFTKKGEALLAAIQPVWSAIDIAMRQLATEHEESRRILESISAIEQSVQGVPLSERIRKELDHSTNIIQQNNC